MAGLFQFMGPQIKAVTGDPHVPISLTILRLCLRFLQGTRVPGAPLSAVVLKPCA